MGTANTDSAKSIEKLSSGYRINRAGDDAAGLSISEKMRGQIRGLNQASSNAQDGISMIQTAEGALNETHAILQRMRELAVQSSSDTNVAKDREAIQGEMDELAKEITRISNTTEFNTQKLINGGIKDTKFHIGANEGQDVDLAISAMDASSLGIARDGVTATIDDAATNMTDVKLANKQGASVVDGASIDVSVVTTTDVKGTLTSGGVTVTTENNTGAYNDYTMQVIKGTGSEAEGIVIDHAAGTIVVTQNADDNTAITGLTVSQTGTAPAGAGGLVFTGTTAATTAAAAISTETAGSAAGTTVTFDDGTTQQSVTVDADAKSVSVKDGAFEGISFKTDDLASITGDITIATEAAAAAVVDADGNVTTEAVAPKGIDVTTQGAASKAITTINNALETVSAERSKLGAMQNRLEHTIKNLDTSSENLQASESRIRDVDMAKEMMEQTKQNILAQASTAMLAQANQAPQAVLQLLR